MCFRRQRGEATPSNEPSLWALRLEVCKATEEMNVEALRKQFPESFTTPAKMRQFARLLHALADRSELPLARNLARHAARNSGVRPCTVSAWFRCAPASASTRCACQPIRLCSFECPSCYARPRGAPS